MSNTAALSNVTPDFTFLREDSAATNNSMLLTPLEEESGKIVSFAQYTTGTRGAITISPAMQEQCNELRKITVTSELKRLAFIVAQLQGKLTINNKATAIVNPTLIAEQVPYIEDVNDLTDDIIERSTNRIDILDNTPVIAGLPVWDRLDGERIDFYNVFKLYRDSRYLMLDTGEYVFQSRTMAGLARKLNLPGALLSYLSKLYAWTTRCSYYDEYMEEQMRKRRAIEVQLLQADHYKTANRLMKKALEYLENHDGMLKPKEAIEMLELGLKYSRISLGLQGDKPGTAVAAGNQTTLSIYNSTTNNKADNMLNVNAQVGSNNQSGLSNVELQLQQDMKDEKNLLAILHVLQASGAMGTAVNSDLKEVNGDNDIIDVEGDADE